MDLQRDDWRFAGGLRTYAFDLAATPTPEALVRFPPLGDVQASAVRRRAALPLVGSNLRIEIDP